MFDEKNHARWPTLVAGLILLIVLAAVAAMSAESGTQPNASTLTDAPTHRTVAEGVGSGPTCGVWGRMLESLGAIAEPMSGVFPDDALAVYDIGVTPSVAIKATGELLERAAPEIHEWMVDFVGEFRLATGLDPTDDFLLLLDDGLTVGLLAPETDPDGWPFPRKVVIARMLDPAAVTHFLEAWISWEAGAIAPMSNGLLGASIRSEQVAGSEIVGLQLDGLLPVWVPLPSPSYAVVGNHLIVSPVRSAVAETLARFPGGTALPDAGVGGETVVEVVRLNFPAWPDAWRRAEPVVGLVVDHLGGESSDVLRACNWLIELSGGFGPAYGTTSLTPEGGFVFHLEVEPGQMRDDRQLKTNGR